MHAKRILARNRRIPGRATGYSFFVMSWPSGEFSQRSAHSKSIDSTIRLFTKRLDLVPVEERELVVAHIDAAVRKQRGGVRHVWLASWTGTQPLAEFFRAARLAWKRLPKEYDDQPRRISDEIDIG